MVFPWFSQPFSAPSLDRPPGTLRDGPQGSATVQLACGEEAQFSARGWLSVECLNHWDDDIYIYIYSYNLHTIVVYFHIVHHSGLLYDIYIYIHYIISVHIYIYIFMYIVYMILNVYICTWCTDKKYCYNIVITRVFFKHDLVGVYICIYTFAHIYLCIYIYILPSGNLTSLLKMAMAIEIVDFPIKDGDFPFRYVHVYQRV